MTDRGWLSSWFTTPRSPFTRSSCTSPSRWSPAYWTRSVCYLPVAYLPVTCLSPACYPFVFILLPVCCPSDCYQSQLPLYNVFTCTLLLVYRDLNIATACTVPNEGALQRSGVPYAHKLSESHVVMSHLQHLVSRNLLMFSMRPTTAPDTGVSVSVLINDPLVSQDMPNVICCCVGI